MLKVHPGGSLFELQARLVTDDKNKALPTLANAMLILALDPRVRRRSQA
jgi:hypothetical protein